MRRDAVEAFPLRWPDGRPRTRRPTRSRFEVAFAVARDGILDEVRLMGGRGVVISTNVPTRRDGLPYASAREPDDPGVAVYFERDGRPCCIACDRWDRVAHNLQAVRKAIEALRGIERWGTGDMVDQAFAGFAALPGPAPTAEPWDVLGVAPHASADEVDRAFRAKAREAHPDAGGSAEAMKSLTAARDAMKARGELQRAHG